MAQRKVSILSKAAEEVANIAYFIESHGMPTAAKKFVNECFAFFEKLSDQGLSTSPANTKSGMSKGLGAPILSEGMLWHI